MSEKGDIQGVALRAKLRKKISEHSGECENKHRWKPLQGSKKKNHMGEMAFVGDNLTKHLMIQSSL